MSAPILVPGQIIGGKYTVTTLLRTDGAVATYHAITAPSRDVALKLFDPRLGADPIAMEERARVAAMVSHLPESLVLPIVEQGVAEEVNAPFVATTLSSHPSLAQLVLLCPLSLQETATVLRSVGRALDHALRAGAWHHALKPSNVFVGPPATYATHIVDFGATATRRALAARGVGALRVTWLAPEQIDHEGDARADVFAAALLAFFAMTGRSYWRCAPAEGAPELAAWRAEVAESRADASSRGAELGKPVDRAIDPVLARALAAEPDARFATVTEMAEAFAAAAGLPPPAPRPLDSLPSLVATSPAFAPVSASHIQAATPAPVPVPVPIPAPFVAPPPVAAPAPALAPAPSLAPAFVDAPLPAVASSDPPIGLPRRRPVALIVVSVSVFLAGVGALAFVLTRPGSPLGPAPPPSTLAAVVPSTTLAPPPPPPSASALAVLSVSDAGAPDDAAAAGAAVAMVDAAATRDQSDLTVTCRPACVSVRIDGQPVDDASAPTPVAAGAHTVTAGPPAGFLAQTKRVTVKRGEHAKVTVMLTSARAAGAGPAAPCGKFLKRCN